MMACPDVDVDESEFLEVFEKNYYFDTQKFFIHL